MSSILPTFTTEKICKEILSKVVLSRESEGSYAVVDERCEETIQFHTFRDIHQRHFYLIFWTLV